MHGLYSQLSPFVFSNPFSWFGLAMLVNLVFAAGWVYLWWRIFKRIGYPAAASVLMVWPPAFLVVLVCLAFLRWPGERKSEDPGA